MQSPCGRSELGWGKTPPADSEVGANRLNQKPEEMCKVGLEREERLEPR